MFRYIFVVGGRNNDGLVLSCVFKFCTYNNTWNSAVKVTECRASAAAAVLEGLYWDLLLRNASRFFFSS